MMNSTTPTYPYLADVQANSDNTKGGGLLVDGMFLFNLTPTTGIAVSGNGYASFKDWFSYDSNQLFLLLSTSINALADGGFENSTILDNWFITTDAATVSDKLVGTNLSLSLSSDFAKIGTKPLKVSKTAAGGSPAQYSLAIPASECGSRYAAAFNYRKVGAGTGSIYADMKWVIVENNTSGIPVIKYSSPSISAKTITFTASEIDWTNLGENEEAKLKVTSEATAIQVADKIRAAIYKGWVAGGTPGTDTVIITSTTVSSNLTDSTYSAGTTDASGTMTTTEQGVAPTIPIFLPKVRKPE
ncbi:hypothetical protein P4573_19230 [Priestia megaterium]|uniref:hypothetical protein n=1 Tax=Priestia megaterium TaxID=1404 RepID=UPI002E21951A|nr:hypothetical protein [Priestia megaterium]